MKKLAKKLAVLVTVLCVALTCALFAACGDNEEPETPAAEKNGTYTVTVVLPDGTPVGAGYTVSFCIGDTSCFPVRTDKNGVATFEGEKDVNYHVQVNTTPAGYVATGYTVEDSTCYTDDWEGPSYTVTLSAAE